MEPEVIRFSRQQLYDLVWETPITTLATTYLISSNGLREVCKGMGIPLPDSGYWSKMKAGKATPRKPLNGAYIGEQQFTVPLRPADGSGIEIDASPELRLQKELERDPSLDFTVSSQLTKPDPLVAAVAKVLTANKATPREGLLYSERGLLDINVAPASVDRALRFMDALIKLLKQRGFGVEVTDQASYLLFDDEKMDMTLREIRRQEKIPGRSWDQTIYHPTGKLTLKIERFSGGVTCTDGTLLLEEQLPKILARVEITRKQLREWRIEQKKQQAEREEQQRKEREIAERKRTEIGLFKKSLEDARCWREAQLFREYISHIEARALATGSLTDELKAWIDWANKKADWLDPLINSPDALLNGHKPSSFLPVEPASATSANQYGYESSINQYQWPLLPWYMKK